MFIKNHLRRNKKVYVAAAVGLTVGVVVGARPRINADILKTSVTFGSGIEPIVHRAVVDFDSPETILKELVEMTRGITGRYPEGWPIGGSQE